MQHTTPNQRGHFLCPQNCSDFINFKKKYQMWQYNFSLKQYVNPNIKQQYLYHTYNIHNRLKKGVKKGIYIPSIYFFFL